MPYLNEHEDRGNISICTTANAIRSTRRFELPIVFGDTGGLSQAVLEQLGLSEDLVYRFGRALQRIKLNYESPYCFLQQLLIDLLFQREIVLGKLKAADTRYL